MKVEQGWRSGKRGRAEGSGDGAGCGFGSLFPKDSLKIFTLCPDEQEDLFGPWSGGGQFQGQEAQSLHRVVVAGLLQDRVQGWQTECISGFHAGPFHWDLVSSRLWGEWGGWALFLPKPAQPVLRKPGPAAPSVFITPPRRASLPAPGRGPAGDSQGAGEQKVWLASGPNCWTRDREVCIL